MYSIYLLKHTITKQIYIGKTNDLRRRIAEHNANQQKSTSRNSGKWFLVYAEAYRSKIDSDLREKRLKQHGRSKQELLKRIANSLDD